MVLSKQNPNTILWTAKLIKSIWKYSLLLWNHWNDVVHGKDLAEKELTKQKKYWETISTLYQQFKDDTFLVPSHLQYLFKSSPSGTVKMSEDGIRCWISTVEEAILAQQTVMSTMQWSKECLYKFLGKELPSTTPRPNPSPATTSGSAPQLPSEKKSWTKRERQLKQRQTGQQPLSKFGFSKHTLTILRSQSRKKTNEPLKTDYSGTWVLTVP